MSFTIQYIPPFYVIKTKNTLILLNNECPYSLFYAYHHKKIVNKPVGGIKKPPEN